MSEPDLFSYYPDRAGFKDRTTSKDAADAIERTGKAQIIREKVRAFFDAGHIGTADEVAILIGEGWPGVRPRVSELHHEGFLVKTGKRAKSSQGRSSHVWMKKP